MKTIWKPCKCDNHTSINVQRNKKTFHWTKKQLLPFFFRQLDLRYELLSTRLHWVTGRCSSTTTTTTTSLLWELLLRNENSIMLLNPTFVQLSNSLSADLQVKSWKKYFFYIHHNIWYKMYLSLSYKKTPKAIFTHTFCLWSMLLDKKKCIRKHLLQKQYSKASNPVTKKCIKMRSNITLLKVLNGLISNLYFTRKTKQLQKNDNYVP